MRLSALSTGYESRGEDQECFHEADFSFHLNYTISPDIHASVTSTDDGYKAQSL